MMPTALSLRRNDSWMCHRPVPVPASWSRSHVPFRQVWVTASQPCIALCQNLMIAWLPLGSWSSAHPASGGEVSPHCCRRSARLHRRNGRPGSRCRLGSSDRLRKHATRKHVTTAGPRTLTAVTIRSWPLPEWLNVAGSSIPNGRRGRQRCDRQLQRWLWERQRDGCERSLWGRWCINDGEVESHDHSSPAGTCCPRRGPVQDSLGPFWCAKPRAW